MTSLLQTAMANASLQSGHPASPAKRAPSDKGKQRAPPSVSGSESGDDFSHYSDDSDDDDDELVDLATRPSTPVFGTKEGSNVDRPGRFISARDPIRILPSQVMLKVFLQLDIKSLARCDRVCKRWKKSQTLNYVWFLHNRSINLPQLQKKPDGSYINKQGEDDPNYDPYDKAHFLTLFRTPVPTSSTPQWSKRESKQPWRLTFKTLVNRRENPSSVPDFRVDVDALSSGMMSPMIDSDSVAGSGTVTPRSKKEMREHYKQMQGRKSKGKGQLGGTVRGVKDKGGAGEDQYSAPW